MHASRPKDKDKFVTEKNQRSMKTPSMWVGAVLGLSALMAYACRCKTRPPCAA